jgi:hypothetical protein
MRWRRLLMAVVVAGLVSSCGGDGGLKAQDLAAQGDERCRKVLREHPPPGLSASDPPPVQQVKMNGQADHYSRLHVELRTLEPDADVRKEFRDYLARIEQQVRNRRDAGAAIRSRDLTTFRALEAERAAINDAKQELKREIGFTVC